MPNAGGLTRRELLQRGATAGAGALFGAIGAGRVAGGEEAAAQAGALPRRKWGKIREPAEMLWLGTAHIHRGKSTDETVAVIQHALDRGFHQIDTAHSYGSEDVIGKAIAGRRDELFIMTKSTQRSYDAAMRELEGSLKRLGTDHVELWLVHSIGYRGDGQAEVAHLKAADGVMKAMRRAKEEGVTKYIGFSGHTNPDYMVDVIDWDRDDEFDAMLFTISAVLARQNNRGWEDKVLPAAMKKNYALIAMKVFGAGRAVGDDPGAPGKLLKYVYDLKLPTATLGLYSKDEIDAALRACQEYAKRDQGVGAWLERSTPAERAAFRQRYAGVELPFERPGYVDGMAGA